MKLFCILFDAAQSQVAYSSVFPKVYVHDTTKNTDNKDLATY